MTKIAVGGGRSVKKVTGRLPGSSLVPHYCAPAFWMPLHVRGELEDDEGHLFFAKTSSSHPACALSSSARYWKGGASLRADAPPIGGASLLAAT